LVDTHKWLVQITMAAPRDTHTMKKSMVQILLVAPRDAHKIVQISAPKEPHEQNGGNYLFRKLKHLDKLSQIGLKVF